MLKKILIVFAALVVVFLIVVAFQPKTFRITRSATIAAAPSGIFAEVNDLHRFQAWSPWAKLDPHAKVAFEGPASGMGAAFSWAGNSDIGEGKMSIIDSRPAELVRCKLEYYKPMAGVATAEFTFTPEGKGTVVTWTMMGENNFIGRAVCMFMNMDKMIGGQFEQGLASLKSITESAAKK